MKVDFVINCVCIMLSKMIWLIYEGIMEGCFGIFRAEKENVLVRLNYAFFN